jgi:hypothetical protein
MESKKKIANKCFNPITPFIMVCAARFARYAQTTPILRYAQEQALRVKPMLAGRLRRLGFCKIIKVLELKSCHFKI